MLQEEQGNIAVAQGRRATDCAMAMLLENLLQEERNAVSCDGSLERIKKKASRIAHRLDLWHKSKHLHEALLKAANINGNQDLLPWVKPIRNYFWLCSKLCGGSVTEMKVSCLRIDY